ncbi:hypothetical protein [Jiulongibacter sp. NS-SX5]|uniref:hypothetical protein n=1 Tax=Jiulongibacter sp. NS-SX5 TaxID=3463854 RepID=UPI00405A13E8
MFNKLIFFLSYLSSAFITQILFLQVDPLKEEVEGVIVKSSILAYFDIASPIISFIGCIIYTLVLKIRHTDALAEGVMVRPWNKHHTQLTYLRLVLSLLLGSVSGTFLNMIGSHQSIFREGFIPQVGVNAAVALIVGFLIMKFTKQEFEDELWDIAKDKAKL